MRHIIPIPFEFIPNEHKIMAIDGDWYESCRTRTASRLQRMRKEIRLRDKIMQVYERRDSCRNDPDVEDWCAEISAARAALAEFDRGGK